MNSFEDQPMSEQLMESCNANDILLLVEKIANQLLDSINLHLLTHEGKVIMEVMEVALVRHVNLPFRTTVR